MNVVLIDVDKKYGSHFILSLKPDEVNASQTCGPLDVFFMSCVL